MKKDNKILKVLGNLDGYLAAVMLAVLIITTFAGVIFRYILNKPFTWLEEVQLLCLVWSVFLCCGLAFRTGGHVAIEIIVDALSPKVQKIIGYIIDVIFTVLSIFLVWTSIGYVNSFIKNGRCTPMLRIPYALIYGIVPIAIVWSIACYFYARYINPPESETEKLMKEDEPNE